MKQFIKPKRSTEIVDTSRIKKIMIADIKVKAEVRDDENRKNHE